MSRLIVKNLPTYITPERLREHFEKGGQGAPGGTLTDFKVARRHDGTARRFGFVGYKTEEEALKAKQWFDRTFIDSTRISVSVVEVGCFFFLQGRALMQILFCSVFFSFSFFFGCRERKMRRRRDRINDGG